MAEATAAAAAAAATAAAAAAATTAAAAAAAAVVVVVVVVVIVVVAAAAAVVVVVAAAVSTRLPAYEDARAESAVQRLEPRRGPTRCSLDGAGWGWIPGCVAAFAAPAV